MKTTAKVVAIAVFGLSLAGIAVGALARSEPSLPSVAPYALPADLPGGIHLDVLDVTTQPPVIASDNAVSLARQYAEGFAPNPSGVSVQAVLFTDQERGVQNPDGSLTLSFVNVPAYVVRFTGVPQPILGGSGDGPAAQELNVVIDARTGNYLEMFSFQ